MIKDELLALLGRAVTASASPMLITDRQGMIVYVNPAFTEFTGYTQAELAGKTPRVLKSPRTPRLVHEDLWRTLSAGKTWRGELLNVRKDGKEYWESIIISAIKDRSGVITHFVGVWQDVTERKNDDDISECEKEVFKKQSRTDDLTGLYNRRHIFVELEREFERATRYNRPLSGMMIDVDDFKKINDQYGHLTGDRVLRTFSKLLEDSIRTIDILGRYGGDEFLLILPETTIGDALIVAHRIRKNLINYHKNVMAEMGGLAASIGLVEFDDSCRAGKALFLEKIDAMLLAAKQAGKNQIIVG